MTDRGAKIGYAVIAGILVVALAGIWVGTRKKHEPPPKVAKPALTGNVIVSSSAGTCAKATCWTCKGPVHLALVDVTVTAATRTDGVKLGPGCTGSIQALSVKTASGDAVKVAAGAHDLVVGTGVILCTGKAAKVHQDGIQALGGDTVTFHGMLVACPTIRPVKGSLEHSAFFVNTAKGGVVAHAVVFEDGYLSSSGTTVDLGTSDASGVRGSTVCPSVAVKQAIRVPVMPHGQATATHVVNSGNKLPASC